jgi:hypothetical protein
MDADMFQEAIEYELLTQAIYQAILDREGTNIDVQHNVDVAGKSGVKHQVDVLWKFRQAGIEHAVLVECKNYASNLSLEKVRNFFAVLHDIGAKGIMVTKTGYQSGVQDFARFYDINLKKLAQPTDADWEGRIRDIHVRMRATTMVSTEEHPVEVRAQLQGVNEEHHLRLQAALGNAEVETEHPATMVFYNANGEPITGELRYWLPKQIALQGKEDGGPYLETLQFDDKYSFVNNGGKKELVRVVALEVTYYVQTQDIRQFTIFGNEIVAAVLKDFFTGEVEHMHTHEQ